MSTSMYNTHEVTGWCDVAPRSDAQRLYERSKRLWIHWPSGKISRASSQARSLMTTMVWGICIPYSQGPLFKNNKLALRLNAWFCRQTPAVFLEQTSSIDLGSYQPLHFLEDNLLSQGALQSHSFSWFCYAQQEICLFWCCTYRCSCCT